MKTTCWFLGVLLFISIAVISGIHGSLLSSFLSLALLCVVLLTFFPLCRFIFQGRLESLPFSFPIGFVLHSVLLSILGKFLGIHRSVFVVYIVIAVFVAILFWIRQGRVSQNIVSDSIPKNFNLNWQTADWIWLLLWMWFTVVVVSTAFLKVGIESPSGFAYRAYFNADFFRNLAVMGSLNSHGIPPDNPYVSGYTLNYYWFFHLFLAFWKTMFPYYRPDFMLIQFSLVAICMFVASLFVVMRYLTVSKKTLFLCFLLLIFGGSYKGVYVLNHLQELNMSWHAFTTLNIEGILRWNWRAPQIDMLYRAFLYAPQHLIAMSIFFPLLIAWSSMSFWFSGRILLYVVLFSTLGFSAFIGGLLILSAGLVVLYQTLRQPGEKWKELLLAGIIGVVFLFLYLYGFRMFQTGSQSADVKLGLDIPMIKYLPSYFVLNWGALLIFGLAGIFSCFRRFPFGILLFQLLLCFFFIFFIELKLPGFSDVSLKVGYVSHVILLLFAAGFFDRIFSANPSRHQVWLMIAFFLVLMPSFVTWMMDAFNSQDISNRKFTTFVSRGDAEVFQWMRKNIPPQSVVQGILVYGGFLEGFVTEIPPFAERSVYLGDKNFSRIFQIPKRSVDRRTRIIERLFGEESSARMNDYCRSLGIDFIFQESKNREATRRVREVMVEPYFTIAKEAGGAALFKVNGMNSVSRGAGGLASTANSAADNE